MEGKAESSARLDSSIEQELLKRLKSGLYNNIYSFPSTQYEEEIDDHKVNRYLFVGILVVNVLKRKSI